MRRRKSGEGREPPRQREVLHLSFSCGLRGCEIARMLGVNHTCVSEHMRAGLRNLRKIIGDGVLAWMEKEVLA